MKEVALLEEELSYCKKSRRLMNYKESSVTVKGLKRVSHFEEKFFNRKKSWFTLRKTCLGLKER